MQDEPAALFLRVLVIDESPRVVGTRFVSATPAWISISKGCCDSAFCTRIDLPKRVFIRYQKDTEGTYAPSTGFFIYQSIARNGPVNLLKPSTKH